MSLSHRRVVALAGVAALTFAVPATAFAAGHHSPHGKAGTHGNKHHGKPAPKRFTATGVFDAGSGTTFTMDDKGGSKDLHGTTGLVITVTSKTRVVLDDAPSTLDQLAAGDHVTVNGTRGAGGELDALHVNAESAPDPQESASPDASGSAEPTDSPDPTDSPSPGDTTGSGDTSPTPTATDSAGSTAP